MRVTAVVLFAFLTGCAASPQPSASTPAAPAPAPQAAVPATPAPTPAPTAAADAVDPKVLAKARALGLTARKFGSQTKFCKDEPRLGTRFTTTTCVSSEDDLDQMQRTAEETRQRMLQGHACAGNNCADGG